MSVPALVPVVCGVMKRRKTWREYFGGGLLERTKRGWQLRSGYPGSRAIGTGNSTSGHPEDEQEARLSVHAGTPRSRLRFPASGGTPAALRFARRNKML